MITTNVKTNQRKRAGSVNREKRSDREDSRKFVREVADAYNFHLIGTESIGGRDAWVIDARAPVSGYEPHIKDAKILPKLHGRVWVDKDDDQLAKMDIECLDTVSFGLFLARIHKGTRVTFEQTRINDEVWLPKHVAAKVDVRVALLKNFDVEEEQTFRDYKKFRATATIVGIGEVQEK